MRALFYDILFIALSVLDAIRTRKSFYKYLGNFWYVRALYWPTALGFGLDVEYQSRDEFSLNVDIGPVSLTVGRDWAVEL